MICLGIAAHAWPNPLTVCMHALQYLRMLGFKVQHVAIETTRSLCAFRRYSTCASCAATLCWCWTPPLQATLQLCRLPQACQLPPCQPGRLHSPASTSCAMHPSYWPSRNCCRYTCAKQCSCRKRGSVLVCVRALHATAASCTQAIG